MTTARRNIYIDDDINEQIEILVAGSGGRHGELRYVFNSLLRDSPKMKKLLKARDMATVMTKAVASPRFTPPSSDSVINYLYELGTMDSEEQSESFIDYWNEKEWKRGGKFMKDWKAAARNWVKNGKRYEKDRQRNQPDRNKSAAERVREAMLAKQSGNQDGGQAVGNPDGNLRHVQQQAPRRTNGSVGEVIEGSYTRTS